MANWEIAYYKTDHRTKCWDFCCQVCLIDGTPMGLKYPSPQMHKYIQIHVYIKMQQNAKYPCQPMNHKGVGVVVSRCVENEWGKKQHSVRTEGSQPYQTPLLRTSDNNRKPIETLENDRKP